MAHPDSRIYIYITHTHTHTYIYHSGLRRNGLSSHEKTWRKLKHKLLSERSWFEKVTDCMIPTLWYSEKGKTMVKKKKRSLVARSCRGWRKGRTGGTEGILGVGTLACITPLWWTHVIIHLFKPTACTIPRVNHHVNCGLLVMMHQCWFTSCNKYTLWWGY